VTTGSASAPPAAIERVAAAPESEVAEAEPTDVRPTGAQPGCDLDEVYNVIGFNENSNALTERLTTRLDQIAADIGERRCKVLVTGYSSHDGALDSNALFSLERAQNALHYLEAHGVDFLTASATGAGATEQFGAEVAANRRVVITVTP
jgi:outer membrane protein OmpA-like peptidoglycan-associated protein